MNQGIIEILLIEDEDFDVRRVRNTIKPFENRISIRGVVSNGREAVELLAKESDHYDVVIMDFQIAGGLMGENLIRELKKVDPAIQIIVITKMTINISDFHFAQTLLQAGAFWYCTKYPGDIDQFIYQPTDFVLSIVNANQKRVLEKERMRSAKKLMRTIEENLSQKQIIGTSAISENIRQLTRRCAETDTNVLITGSSGTGKELVAFNIHHMSARKFENFIAINCGSIPTDLIESELFGYEKGSFTGAVSGKPGLFEMANGGTLFLDEVAELSPQAQVKLLRVMQDGEIDKIGRTGKIKVNVRIIAATNKNLEEEMKTKRFREDLYYRLNVVPITLPPLRHRPEDIPVLIDHFLKLFCADMGLPMPAISPEAAALLRAYPYPGNVRELKNIVQRILFNYEIVITEGAARYALGNYQEGGEGGKEFSIGPIEEILSWRDFEKIVRQRYFTFVRAASGSDSEAAKKLGLAPPNYHRMCKEIGLK